MITNEVQYRATKAHLERFEEAAANIEARPGKRTNLERLELDAVRAQADDLRAEHNSALISFSSTNASIGFLAQARSSAFVNTGTAGFLRG